MTSLSKENQQKFALKYWLRKNAVGIALPTELKHLTLQFSASYHNFETTSDSYYIYKSQIFSNNNYTCTFNDGCSAFGNTVWAKNMLERPLYEFFPFFILYDQ